MTLNSPRERAYRLTDGSPRVGVGRGMHSPRVGTNSPRERAWRVNDTHLTLRARPQTAKVAALPAREETNPSPRALPLRKNTLGLGPPRPPGAINCYLEEHYVNTGPNATRLLKREIHAVDPRAVTRHRPESAPDRQQSPRELQAASLPASIKEWDRQRQQKLQQQLSPRTERAPPSSAMQTKELPAMYTTEYARAYRPFPVQRGPRWHEPGSGIPAEVWSSTDLCFIQYRSMVQGFNIANRRGFTK